MLKEAFFVPVLLLFCCQRRSFSISNILNSICSLQLEQEPRDLIVLYLEPLESLNVELLFYLTRSLFRECPYIAQDNVKLVHLLIPNVDGHMLQLLVTDVLSQRFKIFS